MRGALALARAAKTWALASGRNYVIPDDVRDLAVPVLAHRVIVDPESDFAGVTAEQIQAAGLRVVNARRLEQNLPPVLPRPTTPRVPAPAARRAEARVPPPPRPPLPLLVAYHPAPDQPAPTPKGNGWRRRYSHNPFDPYRPLPSECRDAAD